MYLSKISQKFLEFHRDRGFLVVPSVPLLHPSIPMAFVLSAGLIEIEGGFERQTLHPKDQWVLIQKCFRHYDLTQIGRSNVHLSLFEMPGAFFFGASHMVEAIGNIWQLLTKSLALPEKSMWVTYFGGGNLDGHQFPEDITTKHAWLECGVDPHRLLTRGTDANFWLQGKGINKQERFRKCGPNTEIFYDRGENLACGPACLPGCDCGRFIEIGNILFVMHELDKETDQLQPIRLPFSEAVIGSDRVAMILQDKSSVFELDTIAPLMNAVNHYTSGKVPDPQIEPRKQIIVDHVRAVYYLVADGAPRPGGDGRQRIMRKLIRSVLTQEMCLGIQGSALLSNILVLLAENDHRQTETHGFITTVIDYFEEESAKFQITLRRGKQQFDRWLNGNGHCTLSGAQILSLEKELGMPHELTREMLNKRSLPFDQAGYEIALTQWRDRLGQELNS